MRLADVLEAENVKALLVGAFARDMLFYHCHGIPAPRATMDIDVSVQVASWEEFGRVSNALKRSGFTSHQAEGHPEKLQDPAGQEVDVLSFGGIAADGKTLVWPDGSPWSVLGLREASGSALLLPLGPATSLRFANAASMVYLKAIAVYDRPEDRRAKDVADIAFVLEHYLDVGHRPRLATGGSDHDTLAEADGDLDLATARLVGRDMGRHVEQDCFDRLTEILTAETESRSRCVIAPRGDGRAA